MALGTGHALIECGANRGSARRGSKIELGKKTQKQLRITFPWVREEGEQWESSLGKKGLRDRNSPMCTLSQNGYGARRSDFNGSMTFARFHMAPLMIA